MASAQQSEQSAQPLDTSLRRRLVLLAGIAAAFALLHFVDHAIRGQLVVDNALNPVWNHSGWPFDNHTDKPYIFPISFVVVIGLLLGGIFFTLRGRIWAGYWLVTSLALTAFLMFIHFIGASRGAAETPSVIAMSHRNDVLGIAALIVLFGLIATFVTLAVQAVRTRQRSGRW